MYYSVFATVRRIIPGEGNRPEIHITLGHHLTSGFAQAADLVEAATADVLAAVDFYVEAFNEGAEAN